MCRSAVLPGSRAVFLGTSLLESTETEQRGTDIGAKVLLTFCFLYTGACDVGEDLQRAHLGIFMIRVEGETMLEKGRNYMLMFLF